MQFVNLKSSDDQTFVCDLRAAKRSSVINTMLKVITFYDTLIREDEIQ